MTTIKKININTIFAKLEKGNCTMEALQKAFEDINSVQLSNAQDVQRYRFKYYPLVSEHYESFKASKVNPNGIKETKYQFCCRILAVSETQIKQYDKLYNVSQQFEVDLKEPIDKIVVQYQNVLSPDGKKVKLPNGKFAYELKPEKPKVTVSEMSASELIEHKLKQIDELKNRIKKLRSEISDLEATAKETAKLQKQYDDAKAAKAAKKVESKKEMIAA